MFFMNRLAHSPILIVLAVSCPHPIFSFPSLGRGNNPLSSPQQAAGYSAGGFDKTFSAGVLFTGLFQSNHLGTIVGSETGGRVYMLSDPRPVFFPHSNLAYLLPVAKLIVGDGDPDRGVMPDVSVEFTTEDYTNYRDKDMEQVIDLIKTDIAA
jgi:hypothetical protein